VSGSSNWGDIVNKPAGFADGVDDVGISYVSSIIQTDTVQPDSTRVYVTSDWPKSAFVQFQVVPSFAPNCGGLPDLSIDDRVIHDNQGTYLMYKVTVTNHISAQTHPGCAVTYKIRTIAFSSGLAPAKLKAALAGVETHRVSKKAAKRH
jgi:hypothetical protein